MLLYLPKVLAWGWFYQPGQQPCGRPSSVLWGRLGQPHGGGSCPVATEWVAGAGTAASGRHFQLRGPQEELKDTVSQERQAEVQEQDLSDDQLELWGRERW